MVYGLGLRVLGLDVLGFTVENFGLELMVYGLGLRVGCCRVCCRAQNFGLGSSLRFRGRSRLLTSHQTLNSKP